MVRAHNHAVRNHRLIAAAVLFVGVLLSLAISQSARDETQRNAQVRFDAASIDRQLLARQPLAQQRDPAAATRQAVLGRQAVADHQQLGRRSRLRRKAGRQKQRREPDATVGHEPAGNALPRLDEEIQSTHV